jgi:hypothetical protein
MLVQRFDARGRAATSNALPAATSSVNSTTRALADGAVVSHGVLAAVGYNRRRAVAIELELRPLDDDARHANVVVVQLLYDCTCIAVDQLSFVPVDDDRFRRH